MVGRYLLVGANLYEIPILRVADPSRTLMRHVALRRARGFPNLNRFTALVCRHMLA
jgi:hypothetical protein